MSTKRNQAMDLHVKRKQDLKEQLTKDFDLLKDLEDNLRYESDPKRQAKLKNEIEGLREQISAREKELERIGDELDPRLQKTVNLYLSTSFEHDLFAELDQAGEADPDRSTLLQKVFIDLDVKIREGKQPRGVRLDDLPPLEEQSSDTEQRIFREDKRLSAMDCLLKERWSNVTIIGGPGQGKSTLGQHLAQVHRAKLLHKPWEFEPIVTRIPFRVVLKYFAQWLADGPHLDNLESYLAQSVKKLAARSVSTEDIQEILRCRPCLLILDGLDEVIAPELRTRMLDCIREFLSRTEQLDADLMVMSTSRQTGYENQFNPEQFWHLELLPLPPEKVRIFAKKWVDAKKLHEEECNRVLQTLQECQEDKGLSALLVTPLQVTIILLIIKDGGRPPSQREALFSEYWSTIFRREKSKTKGIIQSDEPLLFNLHAYLGYLLHRRAAEQNVQSLLPEKEFKQAVYRFLRREDSRSPDQAIDQKTSQLVWEARDRLVLFVEPEPGLFGFELRSIQEFFAAVHLVQTAIDTEQRFKRLRAIASSQHWRNVALFFAGRVGRNYRGEASNILELVCRPVDREEVNRYLRPGAWLALDIAADGALGANRDLQYNALEYGLEVLETGLTEEQQQKLRAVTEQISSEDRRDILSPILGEKLHALSASCLEMALDLWGRNFGATRLFQEKVGRLLQSRQKNAKISGLDLAIRYESEQEWMAWRLRSHWPYWKGRLLGWWIRSPQYVETLLRTWSPSKDEVAEVANTFLNSPWRYHYYYPHSRYLDRDFTWNKLVLQSEVDQMIATLKCISVIAFWDRRPFRGKEIRFAEGGSISLSIPKSPGHPLLVPDTITESLHDLLSGSDLMPWLRLHVWILFFAVNKPNVANVTSFLSDVWNIQQKHPLSVNFGRYLLGPIWPLLALSVERQQDEGPEAISKLLPFLDAETQVSIASEVTNVIQAHVARADEAHKLQLLNAIRTGIGVDKYLPELSSLADRMGVTITELVDFHVRSFRYDDTDVRSHQFTVEELRELLKTAEESLDTENKLTRILWSLSEASWPLDSELLSQARRLLQHMLDKASTSTESYSVDVCITFLLNLLVYDSQVLKSIPQLFAILSKTQDTEIRPWYIGQTFQELPAERVSTLKAFLTHDSKAVRTGAAIFWKVVIDATTRYREPGLERFRTEQVFHFAPDVGLSLVNEDDEVCRLAGIALLTFSDYPIENDKYRGILLNVLQHSENAEEEQAWASLIQTIPFPHEKALEWRGVLERVLSEPQNYSNLVLSSAIERYQKLVNSLGDTLSEAEEKNLGLP